MLPTMTVTFQDAADGSVFPVAITDGYPTAGSLMVVQAPNGTDRRVYKVITEVNGTTFDVERQAVSAGELC